jgi:hypothetical protein
LSLRSKPLILLALCQQRIALLFAARRVVGLAAICVRRNLFVATLQTAKQSLIPNKVILRLLQRAQRVFGFALVEKS